MNRAEIPFGRVCSRTSQLHSRVIPTSNIGFLAAQFIWNWARPATLYPRWSIDPELTPRLSAKAHLRSLYLRPLTFHSETVTESVFRPPEYPVASQSGSSPTLILSLLCGPGNPKNQIPGQDMSPVISETTFDLL